MRGEKRVRDQQDEPMKVEARVGELLLVEVEVHVSRQVGPARLGSRLRRLRECRQRQQTQQHDMRDLHQQLRRRARPNRDALIVLAADNHAVGCRVARLDLNGLARFEMVVLDEAQELLVLIDHSRHGHRRSPAGRKAASARLVV